MSKLAGMIKIECSKIVLSKAWWIVFGLVLIVQPLFAKISAAELVKMGLDATPMTNPELAQALPTVEYLGLYDIVPFGLIPMVVLGGIIGASEYQHHQLRTTFLYCSNRFVIFAAKVVSVLICSLLLSGTAIWLTTVVTHLSLGSLGLNPWVLSPITWRFIGFAALEWSLLTLLAFAMGLLSRNVIVPLLFFIPQIYGLASLLASWWWGEYLPVTAGLFLTAVPTDALPHNPVKGGLILGGWVLVLLLSCGNRFLRRDVGGAY